MAKSALITGGAGFVGRNMKRLLEDRGWLVTATDILWGTSGAPNFINRHEHFDLVVHAAAAGPNRVAIDTQAGNFPYNVQLDASMIEWCHRTKQRLVYLSSSAVYSDNLHFSPEQFEWTRFAEPEGHDLEPFDHYGMSKRFGERMIFELQRDGLKAHIVRPFSGYGTDQTEDFPFGAFIGRARRAENPFTIWGNAAQVRDWIHIEDICRGILAIVDDDVPDPVNLCTGIPTSMAQVADLIIRQLPEYGPDISTDEGAAMGVFYRVGDPTFMHNFYTPKITIEEGIHRALKLR